MLAVASLLPFALICVGAAVSGNFDLHGLETGVPRPDWTLLFSIAMWQAHACVGPPNLLPTRPRPADACHSAPFPRGTLRDFHVAC